ncbi:hypothetical protein IT568_00725 [bacterium]|nr:hypothetical protein [bacterium]
MKRLLLTLAVTFGFCSFVLADENQVASEIIESLETAKGFVKQKNWEKVQEELNYALSKIGEIKSQNLVKFLPEAPKGFRKENANAQSIGSAGAFVGSAGAVNATADYYPEKDDDNSKSVKIEIFSGGMLGGIGGLAQAFSGFAQSGGTKNTNVRIKGYKGMQEWEEDYGKLTIAIENKATIVISANGYPNAEILKTFAELINFSGIEKEQK